LKQADVKVDTHYIARLRGVDVRVLIIATRTSTYVGKGARVSWLAKDLSTGLPVTIHSAGVLRPIKPPAPSDPT
jgi:hypothetical protein